MISVLIVDDEPPSLNELQYIINQHPDFTVAGLAGSGKEAVDLLVKLNPQVAFLDIQLYDINGLDLAKKILSIRKDTCVVFATAHDDYAVRAFELNALDYVVKPFDELRVYKTLDRICTTLKQKNSGIKETPDDKRETLDRICAGGTDRLSVINCDDIIFIAAQERKTVLKLYHDFAPSLYTLKELYSRLNKRDFIQVHRSYIVNIKYIKEIVTWFHGSYMLMMDDAQKSEVPVSRNFIKNLKQKLGIKPVE